MPFSPHRAAVPVLFAVLGLGAAVAAEGLTIGVAVASSASIVAVLAHLGGRNVDRRLLRAEHARVVSQGEQRFRDLAESLPHMVWTCNADGACDHLSPQWTAYTGVPEHDQLGDRWLRSLHPEDIAITKERWAAATTAGSAFDTEFRIRAADGTYRAFKTRAVPVRDHAGHTVRWFGSNTDIQELRDAQEALLRANHDLEGRIVARTAELEAANTRLRTTSAQLDAAQRITAVGSWELDVATGAVQWSDELFRMFGLPVGRAAPHGAEQTALFAPESWLRLAAAIANSVASGEGYELKVVFHRASGEPRTAIACGEVLRDDQGKVTKLVGTFQDTTEREQAEDAARRTGERLRLATSAATMGVWDWNVVTDTLEWDDTMYALYERPRGESNEVYATWRSALHPDDLAAAEAALAAAMDGTEIFNTTFRIVCPGDRVKHLRATASAYRDASGKVVRMVGVNLDISEQRVAEEALRKSEGDLRELNRQLSNQSALLETLLQEVHHRVKNNLQVIASLIRMQMRNLDDAAAKDALVEAQSRIASIALIHERLYQSDHYASVSLAEYAASLARSVFEAAGGARSSVGLELNVEPLELPVHRAIPCGLILNELMTNALKHAFPQGRTGTISVLVTRETSGEVMLSVMDDGIGMPDTLSSSSAPGQQSLGLRLVSALVEQINGRMELRGNNGTRCDVWFTDPGGRV